MPTSRLADILLKAKVIDEQQLRAASLRHGQQGGRLTRHVVELGFTTEARVVDALSRALTLERVNLAALPKDAGAQAKVDAATAERMGLFPYAYLEAEKTLCLAMADPTDIESADYLAARARCRVRTAVAGEREILEAIRRNYHGLQSASEAAKQAPAQGGLGRAGGTWATSDDRPPLDPSAITVIDRLPKPPGSALKDASQSLQEAAPAPNPAADVAERFEETGVPLQLRIELEKTATVLRGLVSLCVQKGLFTDDELKATIARLGKR